MVAMKSLSTLLPYNQEVNLKARMPMRIGYNEVSSLYRVSTFLKINLSVPHFSANDVAVATINTVIQLKIQRLRQIP